MKVNRIAAALALALLLVGNTAVVSASSSSTADQTTSSTVLSQVTQFISTIPSNNDLPLCLSGTVNPFTIKDNSCPKLDTLPQTSYTLTCDSSPGYVCQAGSLYTVSTNDSYFTASATRPSTLPSTTYCAGCTTDATSSDWIGLDNCISGSCANDNQYLIQVGLLYGVNSSYNSQKPVLFEELWSDNSDSGCQTTDTPCGYTSSSVASGDSLMFSLTENSGADYCLSDAPYWELFAEDSTYNIYQTYVVCIGAYTAPYDIPYSSMHNAITTAEGSYATSSSYFPGTFTFTDVYGVSTSQTNQLGTRTPWEFTNATSGVTATVSASTYSCTEGTCGQTSVGW
jgi:hypothetical protein